MPASPTRCAHLAALLSLACAAALAAARPTAPGPAARRRSIDVKHVALDLRFDWGLRRAQGTATITLAPLRAADRVTLDAGRLAIEAVSLAGGSPLAFTYDGGDRDDGLLIRLGRTVAAGEDVTLRIAYHSTWHNRSDPNSLGGSDGRGLRFFSPTGTEPMKRRQLWSQGLPAGNRFWFPGYDAPDDWRTTDLRLTVEPPLVALGNGTLVGTHDNPDGTRTFHWRADRPHANHLTSIVIGEYTVVRQAAAGVALESWGYPDEVAAVEATVERLPALLACLSEATGVPYPLPRYAQAFVQDLPWGAGNHGTSTLTENMIDDARTHADWRYLWDGLEAEALAAQWLGGLTTPRDWRDAWLTRGMAHYFDGLCNERLNGRTEFLLWQLAGDQATALGDWTAGIRRPVVPADPDSGRAWALDNGPWARGALVLHQLRAQLGDERFARAMRHFVATAAGRPVGTADFQRAVEASSGERLDWFFDQWVYGIGHPVFEVTRTYDAARGRLTLRVRQAQAVDTASSFPRARWFRGWVEVEVDDRVERVWLAPREVNLLTFTAATEPRLVQFDVEGAWLKELTFRKPLEELLYQVAHDRDVLGRRWAMGELSVLARSDATSPPDRARIVEALWRVGLGTGYWRERAAAIGRLQALLAPAPADGAVALDSVTTDRLRTLIATERSWLRAAAIRFLGTTRDTAWAGLYLEAMREESHPVINAAAHALGLSRSGRAFDALHALHQVRSWKGENRLSALLGLKALGDPRGGELALQAVADETSTRWYLATSTWDFRLAGAETLVALGQGERAVPIVLARLDRALAEDDINDVFSNVLLLITLGDPRGEAVFDRLRAHYRDDPQALAAVEGYATQFREAVAARRAGNGDGG